MTFLETIEAFFHKELNAAEVFFAPLLAELKPVALQDLKDILAGGVAAIETGIATGSPTAALIAGAIAAVKQAAETKAVALSEAAVVGLGAALVSGAAVHAKLNAVAPVEAPVAPEAIPVNA